MTTRRRTILLLAAAVALSGLAGCQTARQAPRYSDDAINAIKRLAGGGSDDAAARALDDIAALRGASAATAEAAAITWSRRIDDITNRLVASQTAAPDEIAQLRSFIVGVTCDVLKERESSPLGIVPHAKVQQIINSNRLTSGLPAIFGNVQFLAALAAEIGTAMSGNVLGAQKSIEREVVCKFAAD